jgi:hypothetical protein
MFLLTLCLLVIGIFLADNHYLAVSFDYLAFIAHRFYRRSNFHIVLLMFAAPYDSAFCQIIRAHFDFYLVALDNLNIMHP